MEATAGINTTYLVRPRIFLMPPSLLSGTGFQGKGLWVFTQAFQDATPLLKTFAKGFMKLSTVMTTCPS
jgi:hypothetical protein